MNQLVVTIAPERDKTRLLVADAHQDFLKAVLPPSHVAHRRAAMTLLEGLALWHQERLSVVLVVDASDPSSDGLCLYDALGNGDRTVHYEVAVACRERRPRGRIDGLGRFHDLRAHQRELCR